MIQTYYTCGDLGWLENDRYVVKFSTTGNQVNKSFHKAPFFIFPIADHRLSVLPTPMRLTWCMRQPGVAVLVWRA